MSMLNKGIEDKCNLENKKQFPERILVRSYY